MKVLNILLVYLLFFNLSFSQKMTGNHEVIFIVASGQNGNYETKTNLDENSMMSNYWYDYFFLDGNKIKLLSKDFKDFDDMERGNPVIKFKVDKRFLKNNRKIIWNINKLHEMGFEKSFKLLKKSKHIFLIDITETKNGQITIKQVFLSYVNRE